MARLSGSLSLRERVGVRAAAVEPTCASPRASYLDF
jgi:hypothetical protein